ncbi:DUF1028 domain-containing protein [Calidifontibacter sp. DB0510]|uniref:DUF1028 domain-containing protein n=1 Tax=Metallococcus carri TaxID=1656884 RepID=A0A967B316_9MICO|nr:DUF1028 domain-containing protein [Metallococcus carri]NHN54732.1 DUF1028 domain-containing protein [Metallococcus carri]NOP37077.1 DUF1028 domain-containing protein [Calidifontibacter sp. DB2511S]
MTFSIVATDGTAYGVAVASKFLAVGSVVPGAHIGVGAVATQSYAKVSYIPDVLEAMASGSSAAGALAHATDADPEREVRQVGVVGPSDQASFTGTDCMPWCGGVTGRDATGAFAIQGNILTGPEVVAEMERAWHDNAGQPLPRRMIAALLAGDAAGGDKRGRQSAAVYAVAPDAGYDHSGVLADLRVDDHPQAPTELARLLDQQELYFGGPEDVQPLTGELRDEVVDLLRRNGFDSGKLDTDLADWMGEVNLETRWTTDGIDARVLQQLRGTGTRDAGQ